MDTAGELTAERPFDTLTGEYRPPHVAPLPIRRTPFTTEANGPHLQVGRCVVQTLPEILFGNAPSERAGVF